MLNDGGVLDLKDDDSEDDPGPRTKEMKAEIILVQRTHIFEFLSGGTAVCLLRGCEFKDLKVSQCLLHLLVLVQSLDVTDGLGCDGSYSRSYSSSGLTPAREREFREAVRFGLQHLEVSRL